MSFKRVKAKHVLVERERERETECKTLMIKLEEDRCVGLLKRGESAGFLYVRVELWSCQPPDRTEVRLD